MILRIYLIGVLLFSCTGLLLNASDSKGTINDSIFIMNQDTTLISEEINEVTVKAFRKPYHLLNIPAPVNLLLPYVLETGSALNPVEALNQVPGVLMHNATLTTNRLTIRGIGTRSPYATNKIKAYFGEIPLTSGDGETTVEDLENPSIQSVEIIKGPSSSLYGAGLGGTLLFHPKSVKRNFIQHQTTYASFDTWKNTLSAGINENQFNIFLLGTILNSQGFRENNTTNRGNLTLHTNYNISNKVSMEALFKYTKLKAYIPSSVNLNTFLNHPEKAAENWKAIRGYEAYNKGQMGLSFIVLPTNKSKISVATFGSFREADEPRPFNLLLESSDYFGSRGYYQAEIPKKNYQITLTSGYEIFRENYNWSTRSNNNPDQVISDNKEKRAYENLFAQLEVNYNNRLFLSAGVNANLTRFNYTDNFQQDGDRSGKRSYKPVVSPRLGANYMLNENLTVFGNISHGFSTPTFEETLLPEGQINPDIKPETGWNLEGGMRAFLNHRIRATLSYYRIYVNNLLVARRTGDDAYVGVNAGRSVHPGLEAEVKWHAINPGSYPSLVLEGNTTLANYHFSDFTDNDNNFSGNLLPGTSRTIFQLAGAFQPAEGYRISMAQIHRQDAR